MIINVYHLTTMHQSFGHKWCNMICFSTDIKCVAWSGKTSVFSMSLCIIQILKSNIIGHLQVSMSTIVLFGFFVSFSLLCKIKLNNCQKRISCLILIHGHIFFAAVRIWTMSSQQLCIITCILWTPTLSSVQDLNIS